MANEFDPLVAFGDRILRRLQADEDWNRLPHEAKDKLAEASYDLGRLSMLELAGQDVHDEVRHARAAIMSWEFEAALESRRLLRSVLEDLARLAGAFLRGLTSPGV